MARDRWSRDPGVIELVEYYDQPERRDWCLLTSKEAEFLHGEILKCMDSFELAARNYFWVTDKEKRDIPFRPWPAQELILEAVYRLKEKKKAAKLLIIKGRQLGCSTLIEAIIAWICMFEPNTKGIVVSYNPAHAARLFGIIQHIYDRLPWWLRPMIGPRKYQELLHLINPDVNLRQYNPGLNSQIIAQGISQYAGVGEGDTIQACHVSEIGSYPPDRAQALISGDLRWALPDSPKTFAVIESRVKKSTRFLERLWEGQNELGDLASWYPLFLPIFFDRTHVVAPEAGWRPDPPEKAIQKRAADDWCVCNKCGQIRPSTFGGVKTLGEPCKDCADGKYQQYVLAEPQMRWLWEQRLNAERLGEKAVQEMKQSLATNPQEAFQYVTETIFSKAAMEYVASTVRNEPEAQGFMDGNGKFHAPRKNLGAESSLCYCEGCTQNHIGQPERFLKIYQFPVKGARYAMGVDVSSGLGGNHDYAIIWVNRVSTPPVPDVQVAMFRSNTISAMHLADVTNAVGRWFNNALAIVDYTNYQTTGDRLANFHRYPNVYRWKNPDSLNYLTTRLHWIWNKKNKEDGWIQLDGWLRDKSLIVRDPVVAREMRYYQRHDNGELGAPQSSEESDDGTDFERVYDDTISAGELVIMGAHDMDYRRPNQELPSDESGLKSTRAWLATCVKCGRSWGREIYNEYEKCPHEGCRSIFVRWRKQVNEAENLQFSFNDMATDPAAKGDSHFGQCQDLMF